MRLWWIHVVAAVGLSLSIGIALVLAGRWYVALMLVALLSSAFQAGALYGERLRQLGTRGRLLGKPPDGDR